MILPNKMATIYSGGVTFSKLLSLHRAAGLACSRSYKSFRNAKADRTPEQAKRNSPEAIDESPGPWKNYTDVHFWSQERVARRYGKKDDEKRLDEKLADMNIDPETANDMPVDMKNPYTKPFKKCIICEHNIELDYKNVQLLSQFISPYTGRIYGRQITGLCIPMQRRIQNLIKKAQKALLMPKLRKSPEYLQDPKLFTLARKTFPYGQ